MGDMQPINVTVRGRGGALLPGAVLRFTVDGDFAGEVTTGTGRARIVVPPAGMVEVTATYGGHVAVAIVPAGSAATLTLKIDAARTTTGNASVARCPDGTTGSPCVTCRLGQLEYRLCG